MQMDYYYYDNDERIANNAIIQSMNMFVNATKTRYYSFLKNENNIREFHEAVQIFQLILTLGLMMWIMRRMCSCCAICFGDDLKEKICDYEEKLQKYENIISNLEDELSETKTRLEISQKKLLEFKEQNLCCHKTAKKFIESLSQIRPVLG